MSEQLERRQIVMDTETTGIDPLQGHRIVEIGAVEIINRRRTSSHYHQYINPQRLIDKEVVRVHGITNEKVANEPVFSDVVDAFMRFVEGSELIIHNAPFDVGFINHELSLLPNNPWGKLEDHCHVVDSLVMARQRYHGQRNSLDALCKRLNVDNSDRELHGALLDSRILADVYIAMTGGQKSLSFETGSSFESSSNGADAIKASQKKSWGETALVVASEIALAEHDAFLSMMRQTSSPIWDDYDEPHDLHSNPVNH